MCYVFALLYQADTQVGPYIPTKNRYSQIYQACHFNEQELFKRS
jgi:hypothetical protein